MIEKAKSITEAIERLKARATDRAVDRVAREIIQLKRQAAKNTRVFGAVVVSNDPAAWAASVSLLALDGSWAATTNPTTIQVVGDRLPIAGERVLVIDAGNGQLWCLPGAYGVQPSWTSFTPTWNSVTLGTGATSYGYYRRRGTEIAFKAGFILGTGGDVTSTITMDGPGTEDNLIGQAHLAGSALAVDATGGRYTGSILTDINNARWVNRIVLDNTGTGWNNTAPFDWTVSDQLHVAGTVLVTHP